MKLKARVHWWKQLQTKTKQRKGPENAVVKAAISFHDSERFESVESDSLTQDELTDLRVIAEQYKVKEYPARDLISKIDALRTLYAKPEGEKIRRLEAIIDAVRAYRDRVDGKHVNRYITDGDVAVAALGAGAKLPTG